MTNAKAGPETGRPFCFVILPGVDVGLPPSSFRRLHIR